MFFKSIIKVDFSYLVLLNKFNFITIIFFMNFLKIICKKAIFLLVFG